MTSVNAFMSHDHDRLEEIYEEFKKVRDTNLDEGKRHFLKFKDELERHIIWEEEMLFPAFDRKMNFVNEGPTAVMKMEHLQIKQHLSSILKELEAGNSKVDSLDKELFEVLQIHNQKEENILYPAIDTKLDSSERDEIMKKITDAV